MRATIIHNPECGTSRKVLEILREGPRLVVIPIQFIITSGLIFSNIEKPVDVKPEIASK